jgi:hypothetical protein
MNPAMSSWLAAYHVHAPGEMIVDGPTMRASAPAATIAAHDDHVQSAAMSLTPASARVTAASEWPRCAAARRS